jgi:hypothetical protein
MSTKRNDQIRQASQSEAHTVPRLPVYEYQVPVYGSPSDNSTSSRSGEDKEFGLEKVCLNNLNF